MSTILDDALRVLTDVRDTLSDSPACISDVLGEDLYARLKDVLRRRDELERLTEEYATTTESRRALHLVTGGSPNLTDNQLGRLDWTVSYARECRDVVYDNPELRGMFTNILAGLILLEKDE